MHPLDAAIALRSLAEGHWRGRTSEAYGNVIGPFGGMVSAALVNAVLSDPRAAGDPVAITVNYCTAIPNGDFDIHSRLIRAGKYLQHWLLELHSDDKICTTATLVLGNRSETFAMHPAKMPDVPPADRIVPSDTTEAPMNWLRQYEFRTVTGIAPFNLPEPKTQATSSIAWVSDHPARALDHLSLTSLADTFILRVALARGRLDPMGTVTLTTYFLATAEELAEQGSAPVLGLADANRIDGHFHDQPMQIWSRSGKILATGSQLGWFKG